MTKLQKKASYRRQLFLETWEKSPKIEYSPKWANSTGYYNGAAAGEHAPKVELGAIVAAQSPEPNNRLLLILGTRLGNLVIFERYTAGENDVYVFNADERLRAAGLLFGTGQIGDDDMSGYLMGNSNMLHDSVEQAYDVFKELIEQEPNSGKGVTVRAMDPAKRPSLTPEEVDKVLKIDPEV